MEEIKLLVQRFVVWTKLKIRIHLSEKDIYFREGEMWWASLGANIGHEQDGKNETFERPILILRKFNPHILWAIPLSSKLKESQFYHVYIYHDEKFCACLTQLRLISSKRLLRKVGVFPKDELWKVKEKIKKLF